MTSERITVNQRPGLVHLDDYPISGGDPTDDGPRLRVARDALRPYGGGIIQLGARSYNIKTGENSGINALINDEDRGWEYEIRGAGKGVSRLIPVSPVATLVGTSISGAHAILSPVNLSDFTIQGGQASTTQKGYIYHYSVTAVSGLLFSTTGVHKVTNVDSLNWGNNVSDERHAIKWTVFRPDIVTAQAGDQCLLTGLHVKNSYFGRHTSAETSTSRGGGICGIVISAFLSETSHVGKDPSGRFKPSKLYRQIANPANVVVDDIILDDVSHWSGDDPVDTSAPGAPIQLGGDGIVRYTRIRDGVLRNSGDIGIEIDGGIDVQVSGTVVKNNDGNAFLMIPYGAGLGTDVTNIACTGLEVVYEAVSDEGTQPMNNKSPNNAAFAGNSRFGGIDDGTLVWEDCTARLEAVWGDQGINTFATGPARKTTIRNCRTIVTGSQTTASGTKSITGIQVRATGRPQTVEIDGYRFDYSAAQDTSESLQTWLRVDGAAKLNLQIKNMGGSSSGAITNSGKRTLRGAVDLSHGFTTVQDTFSQDQLDASFIFDSGASSNYTWNGNTTGYTAALNLSTENRAMYVATNTITGSENVVGRVQDGSHYTKMTTGATRTGYKGGAFGKRTDASNYLEAYVYDDGTTTYLCLDKITAGTRASLLPAAGGTATGAVAGGNVTTDAITPVTGVSDTGLALPARIGTAAAHYPSIVVIGDVVTAELWQSAAPGNADTRPVGTGDAWCSATLTGSDIRLFGSRMVGEFGFSQIPIDAAALITTMTHRRLGVISGKMDGILIGGLDNATTAPSGIYVQPSFATKIRIDGQLELISSDFQRLGTTTASPIDLNFGASTTALRQRLITRRNQYANAVADTAVTFVSGTAWQNQTGCWGTLTIQGGTVTKIEVSKDGTTYRDAGMTAGAVPVQPNWYVKLTHTGAPTSYFMAED